MDYAYRERRDHLWRMQHRGLVAGIWLFVTSGTVGIWLAIWKGLLKILWLLR